MVIFRKSNKIVEARIQATAHFLSCIFTNLHIKTSTSAHTPSPNILHLSNMILITIFFDIPINAPILPTASMRSLQLQLTTPTASDPDCPGLYSYVNPPVAVELNHHT